MLLRSFHTPKREAMATTHQELVSSRELWDFHLFCSLLNQTFLIQYNRYFDAFRWSFKYLLESHKELMKDEINSVCPKHIVTLVPSDQFSYSGTEVLDGKLCLVFHPNCLGSNINDVAQKLADTLSTAPQPEGASILSYNARHSIKTEYDGEITPLLEKARTALQNPEFQFEPGFEAIGEMLKNSKEVRDDWQTNLGSFAKSYFESFVDKLADEKFGEDELLREGLEESVTKGVLKLRVVEKLASGYNEILVEDGALVIQVSTVVVLLYHGHE
jgi:hypothetical protein